VNEKAFDIAHKFAREPLAIGQLEFADDKAVFEQPELFFNPPPDAFALVVGVPPGADRAAVSLAEVKDFVAAGGQDCIEAPL